MIRTECGLRKKRFAQVIGVPYATYKRWTRPNKSPRKPHPQPQRDEARRRIQQLPPGREHWGHRKVWGYLFHPAGGVSMSTVERAMRDDGLLQPKQYLGELKQLAARRRAAFDEVPEHRNRVWQMDITEFETSSGGIWRIHNVIDYASKYCLASIARATGTATDAIDTMQIAICEAERVLGHSIIVDCFDDDDVADAWHPLRIVTDNGPCYKSGSFARFIDSRLEIEHVRTRRRSPHTNGVVERFGGSLKYERLFRHDIADGLALQAHLDSYRWEFNEDRPHQYLDMDRPGDVFRAGSLKLNQELRGSIT